MPLLLEDLAEDAAVSLTRTAERFDAAAKELAHPDATGAEVARVARRLTAYALAEVPRGDAVWKWEDEPAGADAERRWRALRTVFALQARLCVIARRAWERAEALGVVREQADELHQAWFQFEQRAHRMRLAIDRRKNGWQPKDPERYAEAMRRLQAGEMTFLTADEALARLRARQAPPAEG